MSDPDPRKVGDFTGDIFRMLAKVNPEPLVFLAGMATVLAVYCADAGCDPVAVLKANMDTPLARALRNEKPHA